MAGYIITEEDIHTLFDYFQAALDGEENKISLKRLFDQQCGVMRSIPYNTESIRADITLKVWEEAVRKRGTANDYRKIYLQDLWDILQNVLRGT